MELTASRQVQAAEHAGRVTHVRGLRRLRICYVVVIRVWGIVVDGGPGVLVQWPWYEAWSSCLWHY